jgi:hypothetical protein
VNDAVDQMLADWNQKITIAGQNLVELQDLPTYQRLCGSQGIVKVELTGITAKKVNPALSAINDLFQYYDLLAQTIHQAIKIRQNLPLFLGTEQKIAEIKQLLTGDSIQLSISPTPLAERGLLTEIEKVKAISPLKLLEIMMKIFSEAKNIILSVDTAWHKLELIIADAEAQVNYLQKAANSLPAVALNKLTILRQNIANLQIQIQSDPLGISEKINQEIQPLLTEVKTELDQLIKVQTQLQDKLAIAHTKLQKLQEIHSQSLAIFAESQAKVVDHSVLQIPLTSTQIEALNQWLNKLESKLAEGIVNPVLVGLDNLIHKIQEFTTAEQQTYLAHQNLLQTRQELRGRLDVLQAKALAKGMIEDAALTQIAEQARQLLFTRPTPLNRANKLVIEYERRLNNR